MNKFKIVKRIGALTLAGAMVISMVACSKQKEEGFSVETEQNLQETIIETQGKEVETEVFVNAEETEKTTEQESAAETETEKKQENKLKVYSPLDFKMISDYETEYKSLMAERIAYENQMKQVLTFKLLYSKEDISTAIYNVVRIDSDLSNLIINVYKNKQLEIENMVYLADQIEALENVLEDMKELSKKIEESKSEYASSLDSISNADAQQIEKVHKYALNPLKSPIKQLAREIEDLKAELQEELGK